MQALGYGFTAPSRRMPRSTRRLLYDSMQTQLRYVQSYIAAKIGISDPAYTNYEETYLLHARLSPRHLRLECESDGRVDGEKGIH